MKTDIWFLEMAYVIKMYEFGTKTTCYNYCRTLFKQVVSSKMTSDEQQWMTNQQSLTKQTPICTIFLC